MYLKMTEDEQNCTEGLRSPFFLHLMSSVEKANIKDKNDDRMISVSWKNELNIQQQAKIEAGKREMDGWMAKE
jgi:hypothetical protein